MKVLHYIIRTNLARCHLPFVNLDHVFIGPTGLPNWFMKQKINKQILPLSDLNGKTNPEKIKQAINSINPDIILFFDYKVDDAMLEYLSSKYSLWLMNHGIWCPGILEKRKKKGNTYQPLRYFNKIFYTQNELNYLYISNVPNERFKVLKGYLGLDYFNKVKEEVNPTTVRTKLKINNDKVVLFITNKKGFDIKNYCDNRATFREYETILNTLVKTADSQKYNIICKMKPTRTLEKDSKKCRAHKHPRVRVITGTDLIYEYLLLADLVLVQGYSTTYLECLSLNIPTILCQIPMGDDFMNLNKYPGLARATSVTQLTTLLSSKFWDEKKYQDSKRKYLEKYLSYPVESAYHLLLEEIQKGPQ